MGLAVGDGGTGVVTPLGVERYAGAEEAAARIAEIARRRGAGAVVVGLPVLADGTRTGGCTRSEKLARAIAAHGFEVHLQPEYLTTDEARRRARERGRPPGEPVDDLAAQVILEEFLGGAP